MRVLAIAAFVAVLFASDQAGAACSKGMLWPYVRNPGDCLTDDEIRTGKIGAYSGPVNSAPDVSAIKVEQPVQSNATASAPAGGNAQGSSGRGLFDKIGITGLFGGGGSDGITPAPVPTSGTATTAAAGTTVTTPSGDTGTFSCSKGYLWPFLRSAGDCLTDVEKKNGQKGVYGGGSGITPTAVSAVTAAPATSAQAPAATTGSSTPASADTAQSSSTGGATCHKGLLWPFVRDPSDCPTDIEKKAGSR
jgi:hypothetical protein